jgi:AraC-like DNA-binding protein
MARQIQWTDRFILCTFRYTLKLTMTPIYREERFRTPLDMERSVGLWVDRIGHERFGFARRGQRPPVSFRIFGQFAALAIEDGGGTLEILGRPPLTVQPGDAIILFPSLPMSYRPNRTWTTHWVVWNGPEANLLLKIGCLIEMDPVAHGLSSAVRAIFTQLEPLMNRQDRPAILERKSLILDLVGRLDAAREAHSPTPLPAMIRDIQRELERDSLDPLSIDDLARRNRMSPAYFRRLFKAHTGTTPKAFQMAHRITHAKQALVGGYSIKETAARFGFKDVFHFMRVFKKMTGQTAGRFSKTRISNHPRRPSARP